MHLFPKSNPTPHHGGSPRFFTSLRVVKDRYGIVKVIHPVENGDWHSNNNGDPSKYRKQTSMVIGSNTLIE